MDGLWILRLGHKTFNLNLEEIGFAAEMSYELTADTCVSFWPGGEQTN